MSTYNPPQGACRKCGNPDGYDTFWRDADDPHYACGRCGEREKPMTTENTPSEGPYKERHDINCHYVDGPEGTVFTSYEESQVREYCHTANRFFVRGRSASDAEYAQKIKDLTFVAEIAKDNHDQMVKQNAELIKSHAEKIFTIEEELSVAVAERDAFRREIEEIKETLQTIIDNDKTVYEYHGRNSFNRDGRPALGAPASRFLTPAELAREALSKYSAKGEGTQERSGE